MPSFIPSSNARGSAVFNSGAFTYVDVTFTAGVGQGRLTEGPHTGFRIGDGVPQVIVKDPEQTLQRVIDGDIRADINVSIEETG